MTATQAGTTRRWRTVVGLPARYLRAVHLRWLRSIQARVVIGTVVLSAIVIALVGWMLTRQVAEGLTDSKREQSVSEARAGIHLAQEQLNAQPVTDTRSLSDTTGKLVQSLSTRGGTARQYEVVLLGPLTAKPICEQVGKKKSRDVSCQSIPNQLLKDVSTQDGVAWAYSTMSFRDGGSEPAIVIGAQIHAPSTGDSFALFYLYSMSDQADTLSLIKRAMVSAGLALVILVAGVAWLVTRQVVTPVRLARRIAERLAAGRLEERMHVRGQDDIARLGISFNQMAASLQRQIRQLEELSRMQRRFVSDVSHELRTPLTTVRMAADVLHDTRGDFDPPTARAAELLQVELDRFESLLTDLLEVSRFDAGAARLDLELVDLNECAERSVAACRALAERYGSDVELIIDARPCLVQCDTRRVERIIRNLVVNAIHYSHAPRIEVRVAADEQAAALTVRDWGVGLHAGESTLVFNRFWRADRARTRSAGGTGLGLAIALEDAQLHGGWLQAWGEPDKGAQFRLTLPRDAGAELTRSPLPLVPREERPIEIGQSYERLDLGVGES
ncbi:MAG TPA: MtrAB system histidine kinase MtrB [Nocardioidaceae bacterium]|nr:MtrAB system histidine kinase MtrB [Nocardioidaceae bacterium]